MVLRKKGICATEVGKVVGRWTPVGEDNEKGSVLGRPFVVNTWRSEKRRPPQNLILVVSLVETARMTYTNSFTTQPICRRNDAP